MKNEIKSESAPAPAGETWNWQAGRIWKEDGETIALVPCDDPLQDGAMEEQVRRSKLLASAPALLAERDRLRAALKMCVEYFESVTEREIEPSSEAYLQARTALAEGGK